MKIVFMGTPDFAVSVLSALLNSRHEVVAVVTQQDKPKGRGKEVAKPPVKKLAEQAGVPVFQPEKIRNQESVEQLKKYDADIFIVAAFGQLLSQEVLNMPRFGCINVHASLLPKYRGAAPIQWSILCGEKETGVTIMQMDAGLDTGDILMKAVVPISDDDTGTTLYDKLAKAGAELCVEALDRIETASVIPEKQVGESCYAKRLTKALGELHFDKEAVILERYVRGLDPWPGTYTQYKGKTLKIWRAAVSEKHSTGAAGTIAAIEPDAICVNTGAGQLRILELQLEGKKRMLVSDFLKGYHPEAGELLGK